jgi:hypothetical protein
MVGDWRTEVPAEYTRAIEFFRGQDDEGLLTERARAVVEYVGWLERRLGEKATPFERVATRSEVEELRRRVETLEAIVSHAVYLDMDPMSKPHSDKPSQPETDSASDDGQMGPDEGAS